MKPPAHARYFILISSIRIGAVGDDALLDDIEKRGRLPLRANNQRIDEGDCESTSTHIISPELRTKTR